MDIFQAVNTANNLFCLAIAVTEYEYAPPAATAFSDVDPLDIKRGLTFLFQECMKRFSEEISKAYFYETYRSEVLTARAAAVSLADLAADADKNEQAYEDFCSFSYIAAENIERLYEKLLDETIRENEE